MFGVEASVTEIEEEISSMPSTLPEGVGTQETVRDGVHTPNTVSRGSLCARHNDEHGSPDRWIAGLRPIGKNSVLRISETDIFREGA